MNMKDSEMRVKLASIVKNHTCELSRAEMEFCWAMSAKEDEKIPMRPYERKVSKALIKDHPLNRAPSNHQSQAVKESEAEQNLIAKEVQKVRGEVHNSNIWLKRIHDKLCSMHPENQDLRL